MSNLSDLTRDQNLLDAFENCVNRLRVGETPESILRDYPHYAAILRPMLETAIQVRRAAPNSAEIAEAQARVRDRLAFRKGTRHSRPFPLMRLAALAAVITVVAGILILFGRNPDQGGFAASTETHAPASRTLESSPTLRLSATLTDQPTLTPSLTMTLTPTGSTTVTPSSTPTFTHTPSATFTPTPTLTLTFTLTVKPTRTQAPPPRPTATPQTTEEHEDDEGGDDSGKGGGGDDGGDDGDDHD